MGRTPWGAKLEAHDPRADPRLDDERTPSHASVGAQVQLLARGPQNAWLDSGRDERQAAVTFWKTVYRRHTNFAVETMEAGFPVKLEFGKTARFSVPIAGDILGDVWLELRLPALVATDGQPYAGSWVSRVGRSLVRRVRFFINDALVHDHERLWYDLYDKLFCPAGRADGLSALLGSSGLAAGVAHTVYVPLNLLCCRGHGSEQQFLPVVALSGAALLFELELETLAGCLASSSADGVLDPGELGSDSKFLYDAVFLDTGERATTLAVPHELMYMDVQDMEELNYRVEDRVDAAAPTAETVTVELQELNHPVQALVFVAYRDPVDATFEYLDAIEEAVLLVGPDEMFSPRPSPYFNLIQPYERCRRSANDHVHVYSFSLDLATRQPRGSLNFSVLDRPLLRVRLRPGTEGDVKVKVFAMCLRWLRLHRGQAAHLFT